MAAAADHLIDEEEEEDEDSDDEETSTPDRYPSRFDMRPSPDEEHDEELEGIIRKERTEKWGSIIALRAERAYFKRFWKYQDHVYRFYKKDEVQWVVAILIILNFVFQCAQREIIPEHERTIDENGGQDPDINAPLFANAQKMFNVIFLIELLINMYGSWCAIFLYEGPDAGWNQFDCVVVSIGCLDLLGINPSGQLKMIRMLRAFRIFRLFGRVESLKKILLSIKNAIPGVGSTFVILIILLCIFAVLAVDLFSTTFSRQCEMIDLDGSHFINGTEADMAADSLDGDPYFADTPSIILSGRKICFGEDYYGNFLLAFWTMFQIMTGDSWSEAAARPILHFFWAQNDMYNYFVTLGFFVSFIGITSFVLLNLFIAALLDGLNEASDKMRQAQMEEAGILDKDGGGGSSPKAKAAAEEREDKKADLDEDEPAMTSHLNEFEQSLMLKMNRLEKVLGAVVGGQ